MRPLPFACLSLAATLLLAACGGGAASTAPASPTQVPVTAETLDGHAYLSQRIEGHDLVEGSQVRLSFDGTRLGASAGCNQMSGEYEITEGILKTGQMAMTEMACEEPLMKQDSWLASFLPGAAPSLDGDTLTLEKEGVTITLLDETVASPAKPFAGTRWLLTGLIDGGTTSSVPAGSTAAIQLQGAVLAIDTGCNTGSGDVRASGGAMTFGVIALTKKACTPENGGVEGAMTAVLQGEASYAIDGDTLTIMHGAQGLVFTAAPEG